MGVEVATIQRVRRRLLAWYSRHARVLPWRVAPRAGHRADAYQVLVSEAMLQQTQVATVIAYFNRFIAAFPTLAALAAADEQAVLRRWQGLGYYRRARNLHRAAQCIMREHGGVVPRTVDALLTLPGVGRYTAGAIASIAYDTPAPIVDGNVARVLARLFAIADPLDTSATQKVLWQRAGELVPARRAGDFNQAMMELGATVCQPRQPDCVACPLAELCEAHRTNRADALPVVSPRRAPVAVTHHIVAVERRGRYLFQQRPRTGLWANLWQLPTAENVPQKELPAWIDRSCGLTIGELAHVHSFVHQTTHRTVSFQLWRAPTSRGRIKPGTGIWRRLDDLADLPLGNPQKKAIARLLGEAGSRQGAKARN